MYGVWGRGFQTKRWTKEDLDRGYAEGLSGTWVGWRGCCVSWWMMADGGWLMVGMIVSGWVFLLVPAHLGSPGQNPESRRTAVVVAVVVVGNNAMNTHTQPFYGSLDSVCFLRLLRSMASSLFNLHASQSFSTISFQVFFGLPFGLAPSTSYSHTFLHPIIVFILQHTPIPS